MSESKSSHPRVLIVDDDVEGRELLAEILEREGYAVSKAENGRVALGTLELNSPHLILLDLNMPIMNGYEFMKRLGQLPNWAPVIVITAEEPIAISNAAAMLRKPVDISRLLGLMKRLNPASSGPTQPE